MSGAVESDGLAEIVANTEQSPTEIVKNTDPRGKYTRLVSLYPHDGAPLVRALVIDDTQTGLTVDLRSATDGTLLIRIRP